MATNVYRYEERIFFGGEPTVLQGYYMSTGSGGTGETLNEHAWEKMEAIASEMFPECDCVRIAGLSLIALYGDEWYREEATDRLLEDIGDADDVFADVMEKIVEGAE